MVDLKTIVRAAFTIPALCAFFVGCGGQQDSSSEGSLPRQETLYLSGQQWGSPATFNPLAESWMAAWPVGGRFNLMYEPLITYNTLNGNFEPLLGTLVDSLSNNDSIVVDLNPAAKWSDGKPVTSKDVKFIFELGFNYPGAVTSFVTEQITGINVDTVYSVDSASMKTTMLNERLSFIVAKNKRNNPLSVKDALQAIRIVPEHVFSKLLAENKNSLDEIKKMMMDKDPVVSGPYNLQSYSPTKIILKRRDDYWGNAALHDGKLPAPKYVVHPIYKSNEHSTIALREGSLDASMSFVPRIWHKKISGVKTWYNDPPYFVPGAMPMLFINTTKAPLDNKIFRRAIATAIDYVAIRMFAVSNYTSEIISGLIMPTSLEKEFINKEDCDKYGIDFSIAGDEKLKAVQTMIQQAGFKSVFEKDGSLSHMENAKGEKMPTMFITSPAGWTDWEAIVTIAVEGMRKAGIDVREGFVDGGQYWPAMGTGNFDLIMHKPVADVSPSLPWSRFEAVMSSRDWRPIGDWAGTNIGRYNAPGSKEFRPEIDSLLALIPLMTDKEQIKDAYHQLNRIFMEDQPAIPLTYLPEQFYEFSDQVWTNWPTEKNPYAPPQLPWIASGTKILWNLQLSK
ncbi:MAG TPA: ABC transporter substrate-binding protein [Fibrobacteraceae bacterium]|jgi:peptide/nickel transport system substrate-binding protein|nr:ABC transporter substrate-binding protein [Fibrobacter sp.]HPW93836.1 ABC transporter substrate-binding protein [Fibrobacteraceae bacterium]HQB64584.1 ABC transporter substrate-binding protein [Fibrobacteraceae bacterium]